MTHADDARFETKTDCMSIHVSCLFNASLLSAIVCVCRQSATARLLTMLELTKSWTAGLSARLVLFW